MATRASAVVTVRTAEVVSTGALAKMAVTTTAATAGVKRGHSELVHDEIRHHREVDDSDEDDDDDQDKESENLSLDQLDPFEPPRKSARILSILNLNCVQNDTLNPSNPSTIDDDSNTRANSRNSHSYVVSPPLSNHLRKQMFQESSDTQEHHYEKSLGRTQDDDTIVHKTTTIRHYRVSLSPGFSTSEEVAALSSLRSSTTAIGPRKLQLKPVSSSVRTSKSHGPPLLSKAFDVSRTKLRFSHTSPNDTTAICSSTIKSNEMSMLPSTKPSRDWSKPITISTINPPETMSSSWQSNQCDSNASAFNNSAPIKQTIGRLETPSPNKADTIESTSFSPMLRITTFYDQLKSKALKRNFWDFVDNFFVLLAVTCTMFILLEPLLTSTKALSQSHKHYPEHIILPQGEKTFRPMTYRYIKPKNVTMDIETDWEKVQALTLRDILNDADNRGFHLAMAPAFFGFYGYFGILDAWEIALGNASLLTYSSFGTNSDKQQKATYNKGPLQSVAGASAGAMAAVLLSAGIRPKVAADFVSTIQLSQFADFPGLLALFRGDKFENIMNDFLLTHSTIPVLTSTSSTRSNSPTQILLEHSLLPVAVTGFDIQKMQGYTIQKGNMARAARASATFPLLFQPVGWVDSETKQDRVLIDGGIFDTDGLVGLNATIFRVNNSSTRIPTLPSPRVIHLSIGTFFSSPPIGPSSLLGNPDVISISVRNLPMTGPWAMSNGPKAVCAAREAMLASLDVPLFRSSSNQKNHYELNIDASKFCK